MKNAKLILLHDTQYIKKRSMTMFRIIWIVVIPYLMHVTESKQCINQTLKCVCSNLFIQRLEVDIGLQLLLEKGKCNKLQRPVDCEDLYNHGYKSNGVYKIYPDGKIGFDVYCDMKTDGGGWTVIQKRYNGKTDFYRTWNEYKQGFGSKNKEHWLGNDKIHLLTKSTLYRLRVDLEDFKGVHKYASYSKFYVGSKKTDYVLRIGGYSGTAGDSLTYHSGHKFATKDHDDKHNCAKRFKGAWWYNSCHYSNLNGLYIMKNTVDAKAMVWYYFHGKYLPLKSSEMKIKRKQ